MPRLQRDAARSTKRCSSSSHCRQCYRRATPAGDLKSCLDYWRDRGPRCHQFRVVASRLTHTVTCGCSVRERYCRAIVWNRLPKSTVPDGPADSMTHRARPAGQPRLTAHYFDRCRPEHPDCGHAHCCHPGRGYFHFGHFDCAGRRFSPDHALVSLEQPAFQILCQKQIEGHPRRVALN